MRITTCSILCCTAGLSVGCARPHPLAEWDPDAYAPASPSGTWSAHWWDEVASDHEPPAHARTMSAAHLPHLPVDLPQGALSLADAVDLALQATPETRIAWAQAREAAALHGVSRSAWYPELTAYADVAYERDLFPLGGKNNIIRLDEFSVGPGAQLTWTLLDFGRRDADDRRTRDALLSANLRFNRSIQQVLHGVQTGFFQLEAAKATLDAALQDHALTGALLAATEQRLLLGLATMPEVLGARQTDALAGYEVQLARSDIHDARTNLLVAMGLPPGGELMFASGDAVALPESLAVSVERLTALALAARPDIAAAMADVRSARADVDLALARLNPQVDLVADAAYQYYDYSLKHYPSGEQPHSGTSWEPTWSISVVGSWLIFDGEARHNLVRAARARHDAAAQRLELIRLAAAGETWDAFFDYRAAVDRHTWALALEASALEQLQGEQFAFDAGLRTMPDVLGARTQLAAARSARIDSRADVLIASADLLLATGDLTTSVR